jgi:hypothetical protein
MTPRTERRVLWAAGCMSASLLVGQNARAEAAKKTTDGVYGRFDGDLDLSIAAGGAAVRGGSGAVAMLRALFLETAGVYASYTDAFDSATTAPPRTIAVGVGLRPLFLPRWGYDEERGPAVVDLTIDAITLDLGVLWYADERGRFTQRPGLELAIGTEVPLLGRAAGPWIGARGALRWRGSELSGAMGPESDLAPAVFVTFAWHFVANVHLVDVGDEISR